MKADYEFEFDDDKSNSRSGCEKKVYIKLPKTGGEGYAILTLGTLYRLAFNTTSSVKPIYSIGRKSANAKAHRPSSCYGVLAFHVIETSTIEYMKKQIEQITGEKYIGAYRLHDLPKFDIIMISADENDVSGSYSRRIIRGVTIDSESGAMGSDVVAMSEEYTFKATSIGDLTEAELNTYKDVI